MLNYTKLDKKIERKLNETDPTIPDEFIEEVVIGSKDKAISKPFENRGAKTS